VWLHDRRALTLAKERLGPVLPDAPSEEPKGDWRELPLIKSRLAGGYCLRTAAQGVCAYTNICEHCPNYRSEPAMLTVLSTQRTDAKALAEDAERRGWNDEARRHRARQPSRRDHRQRPRRMTSRIHTSGFSPKKIAINRRRTSMKSRPRNGVSTDWPVNLGRGSLRRPRVAPPARATQRASSMLAARAGRPARLRIRGACRSQ
jgi:hypothetical protein